MGVSGRKVQGVTCLFFSGHYKIFMTGGTEDDFRPFRHPFINGVRVQEGVGDTARTVSKFIPMR